MKVLLPLLVLALLACEGGALSPAPESSSGGLDNALAVKPAEDLAPPPPKVEPPREWHRLLLREGESVADLARWSGLSSEQILQDNALAADAPLEPGAPLRLRLSVDEAASLMEGRLARFGERSHARALEARLRASDEAARSRREKLSVRVRKDEMVSRLAEWAGVSLAEVREANPSLDLDRVQAGQRMILPIPVGRRIEFEEIREAWHAARRAPAAASAPDAALAVPAAVAPGSEDGCARRYRVRSGEVVWKLARRWGVGLDHIRRCNRDRDLDRLPAGAEIRVPDTAALDQPAP